MSKFVHLHTHSHYSLLNALPKIPDLVKRAKKYEMPALALTDDGNMYGTIEFYKECEKAGIKPIIGVDFYLAPRTRHDKESRIDSKRIRLILLAKDYDGYKNLVQLVTISNLEGFYYKPRIDKELLQKFNKGLVCIAPSFSSNIVHALKMSDREKAIEHINFYKKLFPDFYIEITHHPEIDNHEELMRDLKALAKEQNVPIVAAHDVYYMELDDKRACTTLRSVSKGIGSAVKEDDDGDFNFISPEKAEELFADEPEALENAAKIAEMCNCKIELGKWVFPKIDIPEGKSPDEELKRIVYGGFERRNVEKTQAVVDRVEYELSVIKTKGYAPYFLVVADLLKFAHENGILSNIRGSVSGSMVTYLAGITNIDPLEYEIPFERFLNPDRPSAPDIDMDFADDRRDEMVDYARRKYGHDKVAQIGTFGTMAARGSVRDITRALGYPVATGDRIAKMIPMGSQGFPMTLDRALEENVELKEVYDKEDDVKRIMDMAMKIEGAARHMGVHAAGVVMSPTELTDFTPLQYDTKGDNKIISQYDMYSIEDAGLLKFDFLGLKNLSIIADTIALIKKLKGVDVDYNNVPLDDKKTFEKLAKGETADLFQLNGDGMTKFLVDLKPTTIHDINAMVALYRPGPIQFIPDFIARKHGQVPITYLDPALEPILQKTYGILVYQDDLLMMAHKLAGYNWGEVDKFRKAVGKKIPEEMAAQKEKFIKGCVEYSKWPQAKAEELWTWIEPFAAYGFNKAHSVSYGRVAYITAYLKANFPAEYMASVMTHDSGDIERVAASVQECKRLKIPVFPPDINESFREFTVVTEENDGVKRETIRFGLGSIKNFGEGIADAIIAERKKNGKFESLEAFLRRVHDRSLNKKSLESLIKAGAMDSFAHDRNVLISNLDNLLAFNKESSDQGSHQDSLFGGSEIDISGLRLDEAPESTMDERLGWEKELLGLYITGHPLEKFRQKLESRGATIAQIRENLPEGKEGVVAGIVETAKELLTKKGDKMCFVKIADFVSSIEVVVFPKTYKAHEQLLKPDTCVMIKGKMSKRNDQASIIADAVKAM